MGLVGFLKFSLLCIDFLAWPVIALGYPLFASMRAVETGSKYHMKKLVIYWTLFSLISLFEYAFSKIIEWIPIWSSVRLIAIFWLVVPHFNGACYAYQSLVHPVLYVNLQAVINKFYKPKEDKSIKTQNFLDIAERYIKENGSEALEKLIANKHECRECENSQRDTQVPESEEKNATGTLKQPKESDAAQHNNEMLEAMEKSAATEAKQALNAESNATAGVPEGTDAAAKVKETIPPEESAENRRPKTPPLKKAQQEWICGLCKVTATNENMLNDHLQGRKHKSMCESLKSSMLQVEDAGPSPSEAGNSNQDNLKAKKNNVGEGSQQKSSDKAQERVQSYARKDQQKQAKAKQDGGTKAKEDKPSKTQTFLDIAEKCIKENGSEALEKLIANKLKEADAAQCNNEMIEATEKSAATERKQAPYAQSNTIAGVSEGTDAAAKVKETTPPEASAENRRPKTPPLKNAQHIFVLEATEKSAATEAKQAPYAESNTSTAGVPEGTEAAAKVKETTPPEASTENRRPKTPPLKKAQQEWICGLCEVTATSEKMLNAHLQGRKHKSMCESLKSSKLQAEPSPSEAGNSNQGNLKAKKNKVGEGSQQKSSDKTQERVQSHASKDQKKKAKAKQDGIKWYCNICDVKLLSEIDLASHMKGRRHLSNVKENGET